MNYNQDIIEQLTALLRGELKGKQKKTLLEELQLDSELSEMFELLKKMHEVRHPESNQIISASKKLSKTLFTDFLKKQLSHKTDFGVRVFDSALLPLPEGVRPASVDTRLLKYHVGEAIVELTVYPITIDSVEIIGQIAGIENNKSIKVIAEVNGEKKEVEVDEFCLFRFERIDIGSCRLLFSSENSKEGIIELEL